MPRGEPAIAGGALALFWSYIPSRGKESPIEVSSPRQVDTDNDCSTQRASLAIGLDLTPYGTPAEGVTSWSYERSYVAVGGNLHGTDQ